MRVRLSCFVYGLDRIVPLHLSDEVQDAFWVPLDSLLDPAGHGEARVRFDEDEHTRPAFILPHPGKPPLWGLTYRLVLEFLELIREGSVRGGAQC